MATRSATRVRLRDDVVVDDADALLRWYLADGNVRRGPDYYGHHEVVCGDRDRIEFGDLAWAVLLEGQPRSGAAQSLLHFCKTDDASIADLPDAPLHTLTRVERERIVGKISKLLYLRGFRAAVATKTLHPKRRASVPVLDNRAIFGTLASPSWQPGDPQIATAGASADRVREGLEAVYRSVADPDSRQPWELLEGTFEPFTRIELFDMCWWAYLHQ